MTEPTRDPVHRSRYAFEPDGDDVLVHVWLEPGGALPPHLHPRQDEHWSVIEGQVRLQIGKEKRTIEAADGVQLIPAGTVHGLQSVSDSDEVYLQSLVKPALGLQSFLEESAAAAREGLFMRGGIPRGLRGARWAANFLAKHREDVVMTFPPHFAQSAMIALFADK